jgi:hypothetical protein
MVIVCLAGSWWCAVNLEGDHKFGVWYNNCICAGSGCLIFKNTSEAIHMKPWSGSLRKREFTVRIFKFLPQYVSSHIIIIQPSVCLTAVCYSNYIRVVSNPFIILLRPVLQFCMWAVSVLWTLSISVVYIVIVTSITGCQSGKNLTV